MHPPEGISGEKIKFSNEEMSVPLSSTFHVSLIFNLSTTAESLANRLNRRKSVFAESYDPEGDDDEGEKVFPIKLL